MNALSETYVIVDRMRARCGISLRGVLRRGRIPWLHYLQIRFGLIEACARDLLALERGIDAELNSRRIEPSEVRRAGTAAAHRNGLTSDPAHIRGLRIAPPPANSGEGSS